MSRDQDILMGKSVDSLTQEPAFQAAFAKLRAQQIDTLQRSKFFQHRKREHCYQMLKTIDAFESELKRAMRKAKEALRVEDQLDS